MDLYEQLKSVRGERYDVRRFNAVESGQIV